jgi:inosine-uridine preferring nucleoside hydrolase
VLLAEDSALDGWSIGSVVAGRTGKYNVASKGAKDLLFSRALVFLLLTVFALPLCAQSKRKVIIDQDAAGPGGTDMQAILVLVNSPETDVLGITVLTGDDWRDEEVQHTLRLLEIIGRTDIPVVPGAVFPLVNSKEYIAKWETLYGRVVYQGAWNFARRHAVHGPYEIPPMPEGAPSIQPRMPRISWSAWFINILAT